MVAIASRFLLLMAFFIPWLGSMPSKPLMQAVVTVTQESPQTCPSTGCAAGQRINFKSDFDLSAFDPAQNPNVQVCVYNPINWSPTQFGMSTVGGVSGSTYADNYSNCETSPAEYNLTGGRTGFAATGSLGDSLKFTFRLGNAASLPGALLVRVLVKDTSGNWTRISQNFTSLSVTQASSQVFVANDSTTCSGNKPCYINSGDDLENGYGTGLKDALDASPAPALVTLLGNYQVKSYPVVMNQAHVIQGSNNSSLTYSGSDCSRPMLNILSGATLKNLFINDGSCSSVNRNLISIGSTSKVSILSNHLTGGLDAISVTASNSAPVDIQFNHIRGNAGFGIVSASGNTGIVDAVANNIFGNRSGAQVDCGTASKGVMDHNYWGAGILPTSATINCTAEANKRLGAEIENNLSGPGVNAQKVTVTSSLAYSFNNQIGYRHNSTQDFGLYIVNHGYGTVSNIPFVGSQPPSLTACSNYWDVFFADPTLPPSTTTLQLFFKYNMSPSCISAVESATYCGQTSDPTKYPLYWYDLGNSDWFATGRMPGGQETTCQVDNDEIRVSIDQTSGRPNFNDMMHLPYSIALPGQQNAVLLNSFTASPGDRSAYIRWSTAYEIGAYYFTVMRSTSSLGPFTEVGPRYQPLGGSAQGGSYQYQDTGLSNGSTYYYKLKIVNYDLSYSQGGVVSVVPVPPTVTPTLTSTVTSTRTATDIIPTNTRTRTTYPTSTYIFRTPTRTVTVTSTPTSPFRTITTTLTITSSKPVTVTSQNSSPTVDAATQLAFQRSQRTATVNLTPSPTPSQTGDGGTAPFTLVLGGLAAAAVASGAFLWLREKKSGN